MVINRANITVVIKYEDEVMSWFSIDIFTFNLGHSHGRGQGQGHGHFDCECLERSSRYGNYCHHIESHVRIPD